MFKRFLSFIVALAAMVFISIPGVAFAAPAAAPTAPAPAGFCVDGDTDHFPAITMGCVLKPDQKPVNDCNDANSAIKPGAFDIPNNGVDEDCDGSDWTEDAVLLTQLGAFGINHNDHKKVTEWKKDVSACTTSGHCTVDYTRGRYAPAANWDFAVLECGGRHKVVEVTDPKYVLAKELEARGAICLKSAPPATRHTAPKAKAKAPAAAVTLPGAATPTTAPAKNGRVSSVELDGVRKVADKAQVTADKAEVKADEAKDLASKATAKVATFDAAFAGHTGQLNALDAALKVETDRATNRENEIEGKADAAQNQADRAYAAAVLHQASISQLQSKGVFFEGYAGGGSIIQKDFDIHKNGKVYTARNNFAPSLEFGGNIGLETVAGRFNGFGAVSPSWDNGEVGIGGTGGLEYTWRLGGSNHFLGINAMFQRHNAGGNVVIAKAVGNAYGAGLTYVFTGADEAHLGLQARLTGMYEDFGTDANKIGVQTGPSIRLMFDVLGGFSLARK